MTTELKPAPRQSIVKKTTKPAGAPRSGKMYGAASLSLDSDTWAKVDELATAKSVTRHAMLRQLVAEGIRAQNQPTDTEELLAKVAAVREALIELEGMK